MPRPYHVNDPDHPAYSDDALHDPDWTGREQFRVHTVKALAMVEGITEKDLVNDAAFLSLADRLIELAVTLMKLQPEVEAVAAHIRALKPNPAA